MNFWHAVHGFEPHGACLFFLCCPQEAGTLWVSDLPSILELTDCVNKYLGNLLSNTQSQDLNCPASLRTVSESHSFNFIQNKHFILRSRNENFTVNKIWIRIQNSCTPYCRDSFSFNMSLRRKIGNQKLVYKENSNPLINTIITSL